MKDKLVKHRLKVDYLLVLVVLNLEQDFLIHQRKHLSNVSFNRQAHCFLKSKKVDYRSVYLKCLDRGYKSYEDYLNDCIRLANDHSWISED